MADIKRTKTKRKQLVKDDSSEKPSKEEYAVAKYLRFNVSCKEGKFLGNSVQYFTGTKAVDCLLESKWSSKNAKSTPLFTNRSSCVNYCEGLLEKGFMHRVAKPERREKKKKPKEGAAAEKALTKEEKKLEKRAKKDETGDGKKEKEAEQKDKKDKDVKPADENADAQKEDSGEDKKRKKKKLKLEMHDKQIFYDGSDLYVWIYDPVPAKTFIIGLLLVLGAIAVCLFPLWPPEVKLGVYYLSLAGAGFIGVILSLCILRMILFVIVWLVSLGKVSFWLLPNLTEDVGFFESFRPVYKCDFKDSSKRDEKTETGDTAKKDDEANEEEEAGKRAESEKQTKLEKESEEEEDEEGEDGKEPMEEEEEEDEEENEENLDPEEDSGHSGSSNDNGYEIVDADDVEDVGQADQEESEKEDEGEHKRRQKRTKKPARPESKKTK